MQRTENLSQARIIDAALREFGEKSYAEVSINTICEQGCISKGSVHFYFTDKDTLYLACAQARFDRFSITSFAAMLTQAKTLAEMAEFHTVLQNALLSSEHMQYVAAAGSAAREALNLHLMDILLHGVIKQI